MREATATKYTIALEDNVLLEIMDKDRDIGVGKELWETIGKIDGVQDVDYDGHFGNNIYVTVDTRHDTEGTWKLIYGLINQYITTEKDEMTDLEKELCFIKEELRGGDKGYHMSPELQAIHMAIHKLINIVIKITNKVEVNDKTRAL